MGELYTREVWKYLAQQLKKEQQQQRQQQKQGVEGWRGDKTIKAPSRESGPICELVLLCVMRAGCKTAVATYSWCCGYATQDVLVLNLQCTGLGFWPAMPMTVSTDVVYMCRLLGSQGLKHLLMVSLAVFRELLFSLFNAAAPGTMSML
jgi:hypothetical protein